MSKVQLQGNVSGTGVFTIASPNSNTDRTLTLPDSSGTIATTGTAILRSQLPAGTVLQIVQNIATSSSDYTSSTPTLRISVSITPTSSSSRFYLIYTAGDCLANGSNTVYGASYFYRDSTQIQRFTAELTRGFAPGPWMVIAGNYLDSPATTSAITYAVYHATLNSSALRVGDSNVPSVLTVMEIAG